MSRIWIYQSKHKLSPSEKESIISETTAFINRWAAHNVKLDAKFEIKNDRFIILSVNEQEVLASGCSIDDSVRFMQELDKRHNLSLFDRLQMAYLNANGEVEVCGFNEIDKLYESGKINDQTFVFDNTIQNSDQLSKDWKVPFAQSGFAVLK